MGHLKHVTSTRVSNAVGSGIRYGNFTLMIIRWKEESRCTMRHDPIFKSTDWKPGRLSDDVWRWSKNIWERTPMARRIAASRSILRLVKICIMNGYHKNPHRFPGEGFTYSVSPSPTVFFCSSSHFWSALIRTCSCLWSNWRKSWGTQWGLCDCVVHYYKRTWYFHDLGGRRIIAKCMRTTPLAWRFDASTFNLKGPSPYRLSGEVFLCGPSICAVYRVQVSNGEGNSSHSIKQSIEYFLNIQ